MSKIIKIENKHLDGLIQDFTENHSDKRLVSVFPGEITVKEFLGEQSFQPYMNKKDTGFIAILQD
jgi:hypothetical protein